MRVLYLTYENVFRTGILQAMVLKPLSLMSKKFGTEFVITSSVKGFENDDIYIKNKNNFSEENIYVVEFSKKLTGKQSVFTFIKDIFPLVLFSIREARKCDVIHCRSYGGAMIGFVASFFSKKPFIFDMRGVLPEETVEVGKIKRESLKFKLLKRVEKTLINKADCVVTVSNKFSEYIQDNFSPKKVVNTNNPTDFNMYGKEYSAHDKVNFIYSGSMQVWHEPEITIRYFSELYKKFGDRIFFKFCTNDAGKAEDIFEKYSLPATSYEIITAAFAEMPLHYSKSDIAFCFAKNSFSRSVCFPVKFSEYIASGLFVLGNRGIGDISDIINRYKCGVSFDDLENVSGNIGTISEVVNSMLDNSYKNYDRNALSFLDWNDEGVDNIHNIYKIITSKR
ncbi:hypothetical protein MNBD_GAMMA01-790 [hydrothermal vent metagenome]|uniref:Glycosyltransferase subfamily 4-like N-terminal domain-containing protein n=1 Tax=hydrothermal vent metagenome TaxID=652676 RepID=A0A3B0WBG9_9ZZZZ